MEASFSRLYLFLGSMEAFEFNNKEIIGKIYDKLIHTMADPKTAFKAEADPNIINPKIKQKDVTNNKAFKGTLSVSLIRPKMFPSGNPLDLANDQNSLEVVV